MKTFQEFTSVNEERVHISDAYHDINAVIAAYQKAKKALETVSNEAVNVAGVGNILSGTVYEPHPKYLFQLIFELNRGEKTDEFAKIVRDAFGSMCKNITTQGNNVVAAIGV